MCYAPGAAPAGELKGFKKSKVVEDIHEDEIGGEWESYNSAIKRDTQAVIDAKLECGTMISRPDPDLPPACGIEEPWNLQVARTKRALVPQAQGSRPHRAGGGHGRAHRRGSRVVAEAFQIDRVSAEATTRATEWGSATSA